MTLRNPKKASEKRKIYTSVGGFLAFWGIIFYAFFLSETVGEYILQGIELALTKVVPTALPFMIISDLYTSYSTSRTTHLSRVFGSAFGLPGIGLNAFVCGSICGFPIGAKTSCELYRLGIGTKDEAERLFAISNNPSCAFTVGAVGAGLLSDVRLGILLFLSTVLSAVFAGSLFKKKSYFSTYNDVIRGQRFSFVKSVSSAGLSCVTLCTFISVFSAITGVLTDLVKSEAIQRSFFLLLEVTTGVCFFAKDVTFPLIFRLSAISFCLGFGGVSVMMQSFSFAKDLGFSMKKYLLIKLAQGIICSVVSALLYTGFKYI